MLGNFTAELRAIGIDLSIASLNNPKTMTCSMEAELKEAFEKNNQDGDGVLNNDEWVGVMRDYKIGEAKWDSMHEMFDSDKDGKVTFLEFNGGKMCNLHPPEAEFQAQLAGMAPMMPVFQDTEEDNVWDEFGGEHDDLFVYDRNGKLFTWLPAPMTAMNIEMRGDKQFSYPFNQDLLTPEGRATVRTVAILAAQAGGHRCTGIDYTDLIAAPTPRANPAALPLLALGILVVGAVALARLRQRQRREQPEAQGYEQSV